MVFWWHLSWKRSIELPQGNSCSCIKSLLSPDDDFFFRVHIQILTECHIHCQTLFGYCWWHIGLWHWWQVAPCDGLPQGDEALRHNDLCASIVHKRNRVWLLLWLFTRSITCDIKPEGALYLAFHAAASKRSYTCEQPCCGFTIVSSSSSSFISARSLRRGWATQRSGKAHVFRCSRFQRMPFRAIILCWKRNII